MRSLRGALVSMGAASVLFGVAALSPLGCGGNSSSPNQNEGGSDAESDGTTDAPAQDTGILTDSGVDSPVVDSSVDTYRPPVDSGTMDSTTLDAADAADVHDAADAADAADAWDGFDGWTLGGAEIAYATELVTLYCENQLGCCPGGLDGGAYDLQRCENAGGGYGWEADLPSNYSLFNRGYIALDPSKEAACLAAMTKGLPCGTQTAADFDAITSACTGVLYGTIPIGGSTPCFSSFECVPGSYCTSGTDGGPGACVALATQGQGCDTAIQSIYDTVPDYMCSYLGSSDTGLYCDLIDDASSPNYATCQPLLSSTGATCYNGTTGYYDDMACGAASGGYLCGDTGCGTTASYPYPAFCQAYAKTD